MKIIIRSTSTTLFEVHVMPDKDEDANDCLEPLIELFSASSVVTVFGHEDTPDHFVLSASTEQVMKLAEARLNQLVTPNIEPVTAHQKCINCDVDLGIDNNPICGKCGWDHRVLTSGTMPAIPRQNA